MDFIELYKNSFRRVHAAAAAAALLLAFLLLTVLLLPLHRASGTLPEFEQPDVAARKEAFFEYLRPIARAHNERIAEERRKLLMIAGEQKLGWLDKWRIDSLAQRYRVDMDDRDYREAIDILKRRVDVLPESLVLVQAAKESAWGRSRFAREGNALFGEWCFSDGCGMVPARRDASGNHEVEAFDSVYDAVGSYMRNLNTHDSYKDLRMARQQLRQKSEKLSGTRLAPHLKSYSERGEAYVKEVQSMIRQNKLETG